MCKMFPSETIEKILSYCDGRTLYNARQVDDNWRNCVDYLTKKTKIWKYCCFEEIPEDQLIDFLEKFTCNTSDDIFLDIYDNWFTWQNMNAYIDFDIIRSPVEVPRITCLAVSGRYIALGSEDGRVRIFNDKWNALYMDRYLGVKVIEITFMHDDKTIRSDDTKPFLIISYKCGALYLINYEDRTEEPLIIQDVTMYSVYKIYVCLVKRGGRISIGKLITENGIKRIVEITYVRIYSPNEVTGVTMWKGSCTFLMNSDVRILRYDSDVQPISSVESRTTLKFYIKSNVRSKRVCQVYRNDIIISLTNEKYSQQFIELFILGPEKKVSKKMFNAWEVLHSYITCMYLYGNTFILGLDTGIVYFYNIDSWKTFDVRNYEEKVIIGQHPILNIDVKEIKGERKFYVASSFSVHEVVGFTVVNLRP